MADLGNRANVNSAIDLLLDDLQPDEAIQPSDHNVLLKDILDTLANGLSTVLRTGNTTDGENLTITSSSIFQFANGSNGRLQSDTLTAFRNWTLPDTTGTIALLSDIPSLNNIYTADGTIGTGRVATLTDTIKFEGGQTYLDNGSFNPLVINRKASGTLGNGIDFNAYNSSNVETNFARIIQVATDSTAGSEDGGLWFRTMISGTLRTPVILDNREFLIDAVNFTDNAFRVKDGTIECLKVTTSKQTYIESGNFNPLVINRKGSGTAGVGIDLNAYNSSNVETNFARIVQVATDVTSGSEDGALWLRVSDNGTITTKMIIKSDGVVLNGNTNVSSEDISLQGSTLIKGNGTSTDSALAIYDNDTTPKKLWDFLDNGTLITTNNIGIGSGSVFNYSSIRNTIIGHSNNMQGSNYNTMIGYGNTINSGKSDVVMVGTTITASSKYAFGFGQNLSLQGEFGGAFGMWLVSGATGSYAIGRGVGTANPLVNNIANSLALGWDSTTPQHLFKSDGVNLTLATSSTGTVVGDVWSQNGTVKIGNPSANITTVASVGGLTVNADTTEMAKVLALATNITINAPTGTPNDNQSLWFRILDNGTSRTITLNAVFEDYTGNFPTSTTAGKYLIFAGKWNADEGKWNILAWKVQP